MALVELRNVSKIYHLGGEEIRDGKIATNVEARLAGLHATPRIPLPKNNRA